MTVKELRKALKKYDDHDKVLIHLEDDDDNSECGVVNSVDEGEYNVVHIWGDIVDGDVWKALGK